MNAIEYFKNNGLLKSKMHLGVMNAENWHNEFYSDLKQIVEAFEFIEKEFESVEIAYYEYMVSGCYSDQFWIKAKQSIELVEKCNA